MPDRSEKLNRKSLTAMGDCPVTSIIPSTHLQAQQGTPGGRGRRCIFGERRSYYIIDL